MLHKNITTGDVHYIQNWSVADTTARDALTVAAADVGKVCQVTGTSSYYILTDDSPMTWQIIGGGSGSGDVVGPGSATDNAIARFDSTTGKIIQNSGITIADGATGTLSGTNTGDQNLFSTIAVSGQSDVVADTTSDTLTLVAGSNMTITTSAAGDSITFASSGGGGSSITLGTPTASTSGTSIDYTGIPAGTKKITVLLVGVSLSGSSDIIIQLGDSGGFETSGYTSVSSSNNTTATFTTGFGVKAGLSTRVAHVAMDLYLENSSAFTWVGSHMGSNSDITGWLGGGGSKSLSAELTQIRITTVNGTDTFDAGEVNIQHQS